MKYVKVVTIVTILALMMTACGNKNEEVEKTKDNEKTKKVAVVTNEDKEISSKKGMESTEVIVDAETNTTTDKNNIEETTIDIVVSDADKEQETQNMLVQSTQNNTEKINIDDIPTLPIMVEINSTQMETTNSQQLSTTETTTVFQQEAVEESTSGECSFGGEHCWQPHYTYITVATEGDRVSKTVSYIEYYICADTACGATKPGEPKPEVTVKHTCRRKDHYVDVPMAGGVEVWQVADYFECPGCGSIVENENYEGLLNEYTAINTWIEENISDDMTDKEKIEKLLYHIEFEWKYQMQVDYCFYEKKGSCYTANGCFATIARLLGIKVEVYNAVEEMHLDKTKANHYLCNVWIDGNLYKADATPRSSFMDGLTNPEFWAEQCADPWWGNTVEGY